MLREESLPVSEDTIRPEAKIAAKDLSKNGPKFVEDFAPPRGFDHLGQNEPILFLRLYREWRGLVSSVPTGFQPDVAGTTSYEGIL